MSPRKNLSLWRKQAALFAVFLVFAGVSETCLAGLNVSRKDLSSVKTGRLIRSNKRRALFVLAKEQLWTFCFSLAREYRVDCLKLIPVVPP